MDVQTTILDLIHNKIFHSEPIEYEKLNGGTVSELYLLNWNDKKYVVKLNEPQVIESEANFLYSYKESNLLPTLLFVEPSHKYLVYSFIEGSTHYARENKRDMLKALVRGLLNHYEPAPGIGWGRVDEPVDSWQGFLMNRLTDAKKMIGSRLEMDDHHLVLNLCQKVNTDRQPFLLHGDCGVHNFIFREGQLMGVIDPTPVVGDPLYDLIYAFCSSPDDLTKETIDSAVSEWMIKAEDHSSFLYEEVIIGLYMRLGNCMKHHPQDFEEYIKAWRYWKDIVTEK